MSNIAIYKNEEVVKSFHVDYKQQLKLSALFSFMQEAAYQHAEMLGVGFSHLNRNNHFWVLSRVLINVERYPKWNETIHIETWPRGFKQLFGMRDFKITDKDGQVVATATTAWLVLDSVSRRPVRANEVMKHLPDNENRQALDVFPDKLPFVKGENNFTRIFRADYSSIDQNGHVNNTKYIDWITDVFEKNQHDQMQIKSLQVNFNAELHWNDQLELVFETKDKGHLFVGKVKGKERNVFQAQLFSD